jgi:hypothetical protein
MTIVALAILGPFAIAAASYVAVVARFAWRKRPRDFVSIDDVE